MDFFDWIVNFFETIYSLVVNLVNSIFTLLGVVYSSLNLPAFILPVVPPIIGASISAVLGIGIAKLIVGWGNK